MNWHLQLIMAERTLANPNDQAGYGPPFSLTCLTSRLDKVTGVRVKNVKTNAESTIDCAGVFVAIGHVPNTQLFKGVITMDENGFIIPKHGMTTNVPGVFVAGDCSDHVYRQAVTAAGMGCAAAVESGTFPCWLSPVIRPLVQATSL